MTPHGRPQGRDPAADHCVTCGDEGVLMRVMRVDRVRCLAICVEPGAEPWAREEVAIDLVEPVARGQTLLVHAGVALANLDQTHAALKSLSAREGPLPRVRSAAEAIGPTARRPT